jgi:DNA-binding GntR family transcriptional regulator
MLLVVSDLEATGGRDADLAYMRVADDIAARIASGELKAGARLRSERDLAEHYEVSYGTVRRAMEVLRERGLITTIHGRGTFVAAPGGSGLPATQRTRTRTARKRSAGSWRTDFSDLHPPVNPRHKFDGDAWRNPSVRGMIRVCQGRS